MIRLVLDWFDRKQREADRAEEIRVWLRDVAKEWNVRHH
jgi:hypothetical protein